MTSALEKLDDLTIRLYLASIIGPARAPFGSRKVFSLSAGQSVDVASNTTDSRVVFVTISRADPTSGQLATIQVAGHSGPGAQDFSFNLAAGGVTRLILKPGETLSLALVAITPAGGTIPFVVAQETY